MKKELVEKLISSAIKVAKNSYSPYSNYKVGAAVLTKSGKIFVGTNVENVSYGSTMCAERVAIFNAVSGGKTKFDAVAVYTVDGGFCCASCLQVMVEFSPNMEVIIAQSLTDYKIFKLSELLPYPFTLKK